MSTEVIEQADMLVEYMKDFIGNGPALPTSVMEGVTFVDGFALIVLDRKGPFQAQLTLCQPGAESGDHSHPTVDSVVMYVTGEVYFRLEVGGVMFNVYEPGDIHEIGDELRRCSHHGKMLRVLPGQKHGATIGEKGGAFISFQHWLDGEPTSVDQDWAGKPIGDQHAKKLDVAYAPAPVERVPIKVTGCRELDPDEVHLCIDGGRSFFDEGKIPGGFDPDYFCKHWGEAIRRGTRVIIGSFDGDTITGAIGAVFGPGMFSPSKFAIEGFWYVLPAYRKGRHGLRLLRAFDLWADAMGADIKSLIHLIELQPERMGEIYEGIGYRKAEVNYIKETAA